MSKAAKITILCEDIQQACFVRRFLMNRGWTRYDFRERIAPAGLGSGEQWVREQFPSELRAYRSKCNHMKNGVITVADADERNVADRVRDIEKACAEQGVPGRANNERVLLMIPKRNIETWLAYLRGESVDEDSQYSRYDCESRCHRDVDSLDAMCKAGALDRTPPPSLERCCVEFQAFWCLIQ